MLRVQYVTSSVNQGLLGRQELRNGSWSLYVVEYLTSLQKITIKLKINCKNY